jgi:hypothetical protein
MEMIRQRTGIAQDSDDSRVIRFTRGEIESLSDYLDVYLPGNLREDAEWDNLQWLYNIMSAWKKIDDLDKQLIAEKNAAKKKDGVKPDYEREINVDTYGDNADVSFF